MMTNYNELLSELDKAQPTDFSPDIGWKEIVVDKTGVPRQAGSAHPEGEGIKQFRRLAEASLHVFGKGVMGRGYLTDHLHLPTADWLQRVPPFRKMLLMPRDHAKTTLVSHCLPPHILIQPSSHNIYFPNMEGCECRILLGGSSAGRAEKNLAVVGKAFTANSVMRALWPHRCYDSEKHAKSVAGKWNAQEIVIPREGDWPDSSVFAVGVGVEVAGARPNVQIKDDLIGREAANSEAMMRDAIDWHRASRALMDEYEKDSGIESLEYIIGCLTADSMVTMGDGTKKAIIDVAPGDVVWSASDDKSCKRQRVASRVFQGISQTLTVRTTAHTVRATPNHPFLVSDGKSRLEWKRADKLCVDDLVVSLKSVPGKRPKSWVEPSFCWLMGFMFGDGWVNNRPRRGYVCFAYGVNEGLNEQVLTLLRHYFPKARFYKTKYGYWRADSCVTAEELISLGIKGKAKTKRLPDWVYCLPEKHRRAFLLGFCAADGAYWSGEIWNVEIANKELLADLMHVANLCGVRTGRMTWRTRLIKAPNSPKPIRATCYRSSFNFGTIDRVEMSGSRGSAGKNVGRDTKLPKELRFERVISVWENKIAEPVYDLTVEGTPSFFANNIAVHNTRWAVFDSYAYILQGDEEVGPDFSVEVLIRRILEKNEKSGNLHPIWPERFPPERIDQLRSEFGTMFYLLYMNEASDPNLVDFDLNQVRLFELGGVAGNEITFDSERRDACLEERFKAKPEEAEEAKKPPQGIPLNADTWDYHFGKGRGQYMRLKYG